jgi:hypothetical protein
MVILVLVNGTVIHLDGQAKHESFFFFFWVGGDWGLLCFQSRHSTARATLSVHFALVILEKESWEKFAQAGLKLQFSHSQPPK